MRIIKTNEKIVESNNRIKEKIYISQSDVGSVVEIEYQARQQPVIRMFHGV